MRPRFGEALKQYNIALAQKERAGDDPTNDRQLEVINNAIAYELKRTADARGNTVDVQKSILALQEKKRAVMDHLREQLHAIDQGTPLEEHSSTEKRRTQAKVVAHDGKLFIVRNQKKNEREQLTLGELLTDGDWGIDYALDATVPRAMQKRFVVENAKRELRHVLNRQIVRDEVSSRQTDSQKQLGYEAFEAENLDRGVESWAGGHIAELMIENLLKKLCIDSGSDMEVFPADFHDDMELKIDFIIQKKIEKRGVRVEGIEDEGRTEQIGIQFTLQSDPEVLNHKLNQIRYARHRLLAKKTRVKDIILVSVPLQNIRRLFFQWSGNGKPPGGPDREWDPQTKRQIIHEVLKGFVDSQEIERMFVKAKKAIG